MTLPYRQERVLRRASHALRRSGHELASMLSIFARLAAAAVVRNRVGEPAGIEAVVDKDFTSGLLAQAPDADLLVLLTDVAAIGSLGDADAILAGKAGTIVTPSGRYP